MGVFGLEAPVAVVQVHTDGSGTNVAREVQLVSGSLDTGYQLVGFILAYKSGPEGEAQFALGHAVDNAVEVHFAVKSAYQAGGLINPEETLRTRKGFEGDTLERTQGDVETSYGVVESQVTVFVCTQNHAAAELLIEVTGCDAEQFALVTGKVVGYAGTFISGIETQHRVQISLKAQSGTEVAIGVKNVGTAVGEKLFGHILCANHGVGMRNLSVQLYVAGDMPSQNTLCKGGAA